jgi:hypothetical protein
MSSDKFINEYIEKKLIKKEKIGIGQIEKLIQYAEKNLKASENTLKIDEACAYEIRKWILIFNVFMLLKTLV